MIFDAEDKPPIKNYLVVWPTLLRGVSGLHKISASDVFEAQRQRQLFCRQHMILDSVLYVDVWLSQLVYIQREEKA